MIIGFDGSRAFVKNRTGTENYSYQLLKHLAKIDQTNKYLVYLRPSSDLGELSYLKKQPNFHFKTLNYPRLWTQFGLAKHTFSDKLDVLFVPAHTLPLIRRPNLKTVITVHDLGSEYLPKTHQLKQRLYLGLMQKFQLKGATKLIAVSKATKDDLINRLEIGPEKINVIYEGFDQSLFKPVKSDVLVDSLKEFDLKIKDYFLFVGTIQPRKNLERLIKAYDQSYGQTPNGPKLVLAGSKGWLSDEIYKLRDSFNLQKKVLFLGRVEDSRLPALYSGAIGLVFPSLFEGFGLPILEAFACDCPVICSNIPSLREVAQNSAILIDPEDTKSISAEMNQLLNDQVRESYIKKGQLRLRDFSWEKCARETLAVIASI
jgi:glycosyltransferase involved in cell wall biosynthesis